MSAQTREESREKSRQMRAARAADEARGKRQRRTVTIFALVGILGLVAAIAIAVAASITSEEEVAATGKVVVPANVEAGAFTVGAVGAPVTLDLYYDYLCPACGAFESVNAGDLSRLISQGTLRVNLHVMAFLDEQSQGTAYSSRAGNAYAEVVNGAPDQVWAFHTALYAEQPQEGTEGLSDEEIEDLAVRAGVPAEVAAEFTRGRYRDWVARSTEDAFATGVTSTPTVIVNGDAFAGDWSASGELATAIETVAASGDG